MFVHRNNGVIFIGNTAVGVALDLTKISDQTFHQIKKGQTYQIKSLELDLSKKEIIDLVGSNSSPSISKQSKGFEMTTHEGSCFDTINILRDCWFTKFSKSYVKNNKFYIEDLEIAGI